MESRKHTNLVALLMVIPLLLSALVIGLGIYRATDKGDWVMIAAGAIGIVLTLALSIVSYILMPKLVDHSMTDARLDAMAERLNQMTQILGRISELQLLSDRAKGIAFREKDRDALRRAIQEEINRGDWDAAIRLADEMEAAFGYKGEATRFRQEVNARKQEHQRRQIQEVVDVIDRHTRTEQWNAALREAERLMTVHPENEQVRNLPQEIDRRRLEHKRRLLESWQEAANRHDIDGSIEILKQLDAYLTPVEAAGMEDSVRQIFKEKREQLSRQFADAVKDHKWLEAIRVGEVIARDFPEARMAQEVKEKLPLLRQKASEMGAAAILPAGV